jgi:acetyl-CoA carboxylase biotin carboxyl carrier protein
MDLRKLKTLIELVETSGISELEVTEGEEKVRIVKSGSAPSGGMVMLPQAQPMMAPGIAPAAGVPAAAPAAPAPVTGFTVKSPMVGTFYRSSSPTSAVFVDIGSKVAEGDTVCIIEAMKLMNEIESEYEGEVVKVYAENGQPLQYGERLFAIKTT